MTGQLQPWTHDFGFFCGNGWHVQRVGHSASQQIVRNLFCNLQGNVFLCLGGCGTQVRGTNNVWQVEQRVFFGGLFAEYVKRSACDVTRFQQVGQRNFVNQTTTGTVDDANAFFGFRKVLGRQDVTCAIGQWNVQRDEISACQQVVQLYFFDAHFVGFLFRQEWIERDNLHLQAKRAITDDAADVARADHAKCFAGQLDTHELRLFPFARMGRG